MVSDLKTIQSSKPIAKNNWSHSIKKLWKNRRDKKSPADFEHVYLPDDGQEFLKPSEGTLIQELQDLSGGQRDQAIVYFQEGDRAFREWRYRDATNNYLASGRIIESLAAYSAHGVALIMVSELREAVETLDKARILAQNRQAIRFEIAVGINAGQVYNDLGDLERAQECFKVVRDLCQKIKDHSLEAIALRHLGVVLKNRGDYSKAIECCEKAVQNSSDLQDNVGKAAGFSNIAFIYLTQRDLKHTEELLRSSIASVSEIGNHYQVGRLWTNLSNTLLEKGNLIDAKEALGEASRIHRQLQYRHGEIRNIIDLGILNCAEGKLEDGFQALELAVQQSVEIEYRRGEIRARESLGMFHLQNQSDGEARLMLEQVHYISEKIGLSCKAIDISSMLACISDEAPLTDSIQLQLENCLHKSRSLKFPLEEINILQRLGRLQLSLGHFFEAEKQFLSALYLSKNIENRGKEAENLILLSMAYENNGDIDQSTETKAMAQAIFADLGCPTSS